MNGSLLRSRWAAIGAAVAVSFGGGAAWIAQATGSSSSPAASLTAIAPCRLMDTRPSPNTVGPRSTPIGANATYTATVWGTNGNCTIPTSAVAVSLNVTVVNPTAGSYLTVYPTDATRPTASNLNFAAGQVIPNAVTAKLSATGTLSFYNLAGTVNVIADIVGYYAPTATTGGPANLGFSTTTPSPGDSGGHGTSIIIGIDGLPIISHTSDNPESDLLVTHCSDTACTTSVTSVIESVGEFQDTSLTIGTDGLPIISYYDLTNGDLKAANCDDTACTTATTAVLEPDFDTVS